MGKANRMFKPLRSKAFIATQRVPRDRELNAARAALRLRQPLAIGEFGRGVLDLAVHPQLVNLARQGVAAPA